MFIGHRRERETGKIPTNGMIIHTFANKEKVQMFKDDLNMFLDPFASSQGVYVSLGACGFRGHHFWKNSPLSGRLVV